MMMKKDSKGETEQAGRKGDDKPAAQEPKPGTQDTKQETGKMGGQNAKPETQNTKQETAGAGPATTGPDMTSVVKEVESAMFAIRFYPVAVNEQSKDEAVAKLERIYSKGSETVRQMLLYSIHESLATCTDLKVMHTFDYFKMKSPALDAAQQRMSVYRAIFNYNTSLEGLVELIRLLSRFGNDDSAKLLTYHFSHLCASENEAHHMLRSAILEALGRSESKYALMALLEYARYTDSERTFNRIVSALVDWEERLDKLKMPEKERAGIKEKLREIVTSEFRGSHYG